MKKSILLAVLLSVPYVFVHGQKPDTLDKKRLEAGLEVSSFFKNQQLPFVLFRYNTKPVSIRFYASPVLAYNETTTGPFKGNSNKMMTWKIAAGLQKNIRFSRGVFYFGSDIFIEKGNGYTKAGTETFDKGTDNKGFCLLTGLKFRLFDKVYLDPEIGYQFKWWITTDEYNGNKNGADFGFNYWGLFITYII